MSNDNEAYQQLMALRIVRTLTGGLHEAQVFQLKHYPFVAFDSLDSIGIDYQHDSRTLVYDFSVKDDKTIRKSKKNIIRFQNIEKWVRNLLGDDISLVITNKNKTKYKSNGLTVNTKQPPL